MGLFDWLLGASKSGRRPRGRAALSAAFLAAQRPRLDAIGPWSVEADADNLDIHWPQPAALRGHWVALGLQFHTDSGSASFDPDERMFELLELFRSRQQEFAGQLRGLTTAALGVVGSVETARVVVYREGHGGGGSSYTLQVMFTFDGDPEHLYWADYDEEAGGFRTLDC